MNQKILQLTGNIVDGTWFAPSIVFSAYILAIILPALGFSFRDIWALFSDILLSMNIFGSAGWLTSTPFFLL